MLFDRFPSDSQVWIYGSNRFFTESEKNFIDNELKQFVANWAAHGSELFADATVLHNNFVIIVADENKVKASGCSIDSSTRFIKELGKALNIDFFDRLSILIEKEGEFKRVHFNDLSKHPDWNVFDPMIKTLQDLRENWVKPVNQSAFVR